MKMGIIFLLISHIWFECLYNLTYITVFGIVAETRFLFIRVSYSDLNKKQNKTKHLARPWNTISYPLNLIQIKFQYQIYLLPIIRI